MISVTRTLTVVALTATVSLTAAAGPEYKAVVPASLLTPDHATSKYLGDLNFNDGFPTEETIKKSYDFLDTSRAVSKNVEVLENGIVGDHSWFTAGNLHVHKQVISYWQLLQLAVVRWHYNHNR